MQEQDFDFERYKSLDVSKARPARLNPKIKQLQDNLGVTAPKDDLVSFFDSDVRSSSITPHKIDCVLIR